MADKQLTIADAEKRRVPTLIYSRIVGYLTPVENWNTGKRQEYEDRVVFKLPKETRDADA